jgi:hypothetical protein
VEGEIVRCVPAQQQGGQGRQGAEPQGRGNSVNNVGGEMEKPAGSFGCGAVTRPGEAGGHDKARQDRQAPERPSGFHDEEHDAAENGDDRARDHSHAQSCSGDHK